jgi:hypothetical protein
MFLLNVDWLSIDYMALDPRRWNSWESVAIGAVDASRVLCAICWHCTKRDEAADLFAKFLSWVSGNGTVCSDLCVCPTRLSLSNRDHLEEIHFLFVTRAFFLNFPPGKCLIIDPFLIVDRSTPWTSPCVWGIQTYTQRKFFQSRLTYHHFVLQLKDAKYSPKWMEIVCYLKQLTGVRVDRLHQMVISRVPTRSQC